MKVELPMISRIIGMEEIESKEGFITLPVESFLLLEKTIFDEVGSRLEERLEKILTEETEETQETEEILTKVEEIKEALTPEFILVREFKAVESGTGFCIPNESLPKIKENIPDYLKEGFPSSVFGKEGYPMIGGLKYYNLERLKVLYKIINDKISK